MTWTVRQTVSGKRVQTRDYGSYATEAAAREWRDRVIGRDAKGFDVVRVVPAA